MLIKWSGMLQVPFEQHYLAPFAGLEICISGYVKKKSQMGSVINQFGGRYNAELNKATCHVLVCELPSGQKYKYVGHFDCVTSHSTPSAEVCCISCVQRLQSRQELGQAHCV